MSLALQLLAPFRRGAVAFPRGSLVRSGCVAVVKRAGLRKRSIAALPEIRPLDRPDISFEPVDSMVMDAVYWLGVQGYEGVLADVWAGLCRDARNVLEVGGNVGFYTVLGGKTARGRYCVVEPVPQVAAILRSNLRRNGLAGVEVLEGAAIAEGEPRQVRINMPDEGRQAPVGAHLTAGVEISERSSLREFAVAGFPFASLAEGRDLIKIDAEGIEHALLEAAMPVIERERPTIVIEVLPEAARLGQLLAAMAGRIGYVINIVPAYGSNTIVTARPDQFTSATPAAHNSKDVVLSLHAL